MDTGTAIGNLAECLEKMGMEGDALELYGECANIFRKVLGRKHGRYLWASDRVQKLIQKEKDQEEKDMGKKTAFEKESAAAE